MSRRLAGFFACSTLLARVVSAQQSGSPASVSRREQALVDSVEAAELRFFHEWGQVWRLSEDARTPEPMGSVATRIGRPAGQPPRNATLPYSVRDDSTRARNMHLHCHPGTAKSTGFAWVVRENSMIRSRYAGWFSVCPSWVFEPVRNDERLEVDAALEPQYQGPTRAARQSLLALVESASHAAPSNGFLIGQRIRFLLELGNTDGALEAARGCGADRWWCASLTGLVLTRRRQWVDAEVAFDSAAAALSDRERCRWTDIGVLLDESARTEYGRATCALRESINRRIWWLADPLWSVPGNERRMEQFARTVEIAIRTALDRDERYDWRYAAGGDALEEMVTRYGWPSYMWWGGPANDRSHSGYLKGAYASKLPAPLHEPYSTFEYSMKRQHLLPLWKVVVDPLTARASDWQINAPDTSASGEPAEYKWWPFEHYAPPYPLYQLVDGQIAMLRRDSTIVFATSMDLALSHLPRALGSPVTASLIASDAPGSFKRVAERNGPVNSRIVLFGDIAPHPTLISIEMPSIPSRQPAARSRFAVAPPSTLAALNDGDLAVSDPVILLAPSGDEAAPVEVNAALEMMAASERIPATRRIAVYWESYGFKPTDSVEVAVWIERYTSQGVLRRFGNALNVTRDLNTPVVTTWREPQPGIRMNVIKGRVPIVGRSVVLDVSSLPRGSYWLDVAVAKQGQQPVRGRRNFVIE